MKWEATYSNFSIVEDQTVAEHFLKLSPEGLVKISFVDQGDKYSLHCASGTFSINQFVITPKFENQIVPGTPNVARRILRPSEEHTSQGVFQYKHCVADNGNTNTVSLLATYNLGFRQVIGDNSMYQRLTIDGVTGKVSMTIRLENLSTRKTKEVTSPIPLDRTKSIYTIG